MVVSCDSMDVEISRDVPEKNEADILASRSTWLSTQGLPECPPGLLGTLGSVEREAEIRTGAAF